MKNQIFITMDGGLIQDVAVSIDLSDVEITVIDFDADADPDDKVKEALHCEHAVIDEYPSSIINDKNLEFWEGILKVRKN